MSSVRPGWLVAFCAATLSVSAWLPWLTTADHGGGRASAIGGAAGNLELPSRFGAGQLIVLLASGLLVAGAMAARGLSTKTASVVAVVISLLIAGLTAWYYHLNVSPPVVAGYGLYIGAGAAIAAVACSIWTLLSSVLAGRVAP